MPTLPFTIDRGPGTYQDVSPEEAEELLALGAVVLDVRTPREHEAARCSRPSSAR